MCILFPNAKLYKLVQSVKLLWAQHKDSGAFRAIVAQEFERALADLSTDQVMKDEAEVTTSLALCCNYLNAPVALFS